jgi:RNA polymerase sigma-70 factor (ECF subfamily)
MIKNNLSDAELLSHYKQGNEKAFEVLLRRHKSKIYSTIFTIVKDQYVAEDLMQDVFIKIIDIIRSGRYNEEGKFIQWASRMAHNLAIDNFRRNKRYPTIVLEDGMNVFNSLHFAEETVEDVRIKNETHTSLRNMIQTLPEPQREVLLMRHYAEMSFQEIAEATGVSINTSLGRMRYALINLRKLIEKTNVAYDQYLYAEK